MINFTPGFQVQPRHAVLAQAAPPPAPSPMPPAAAPAPAPAAPAFLGGFLDTLKWAAIGFGAGALTGYTLGKTGVIGGQGKGADVSNGLLGGLGGVAASVLPGLLGMK